MEFVHPVLNEIITAIGGHYSFTKEDKIKHADREILYLIGFGAVDSSCCGFGGCIYALVPGYVITLHAGLSKDRGQPISLVEPVDELTYPSVAKVLKEKEGVIQVHFLTATGDKRVVF